jgi:Uma2 family endonuclease
MRAVIVHVTDEELAHRRRTGLDRWDEMWDGVLHMTPAPSLEHQRVLDRLIEFLGPLMRNSGRGQLVSGINVFRESKDYRIPDLTFVTRERAHIFHSDGTRNGGPDAVIEIRSPEDESYEKLPFYAAIGVREVIVVDRDTKRVEVYRLSGSRHVLLQPDAEGWLGATTMQVRFRTLEKQPPMVRLEDALDAGHATEI